MKGRLLDAIPLNSLTAWARRKALSWLKIGLHTVQDLLLHLPLRYEDSHTSCTKLAICCPPFMPPLKAKS